MIPLFKRDSKDKLNNYRVNTSHREIMEIKCNLHLERKRLIRVSKHNFVEGKSSD